MSEQKGHTLTSFLQQILLWGMEGQQARLDHLIYFKDVVWSCVLARLVRLLLGLPFSAMATAGKRGSEGDCCCAAHLGGLRVLGVSGPRRAALHSRVRAEASGFKILWLQTHLSLLVSLSLRTKTGSRSWAGSWIKKVHRPAVWAGQRF